MNKVVSFIIPSYNVEKYISKCLDSFIEEKVMECIEVLVVNDGSKDRTSSIAHKYEERYPDIFRVFDKENGGHGSTINVGVEKACGKYIKVIDADDWVDQDQLLVYVQKLQEISADIVLTPFNTYDIGSKITTKHALSSVDFEKIISLAKVLENFSCYDECLCFHGITYNREYYMSCKLQLSEHVFYEDNEYATFPFYKAKTIGAIDAAVYQYRVGDTEQSVSIQSRVKRLDDEKKVIDRMLAFYEKKVTDAEIKKYFIIKIGRVLASHWITCLLAYEDRKKGKKRAIELYKEIQKYPEIKNAVVKKYIVLRIAHGMHMSFQRFMNMIEKSKKRRFK